MFMEDNMKTEKNSRQYYIDNLRLVMIVLVVMVHLGCTYSTIGSWYYYEEKMLDDVSLIIFALFQSFSQAYFMGFLFLLAGFFVPSSYDKKGFFRFVGDRFFRLGIPTLIYMLIIHPFIMIILLGNPFNQSYIQYILSFTFIGESGPLWFAFALLFFSIIYGLIRVVVGQKLSKKIKPVPDIRGILIVIMLIGMGSFMVRLVQPIGTSVINMQLCFFTQYIILFVIGILAYRNNWFEQLKFTTGIRFLSFVFTGGIAIWLCILLLGGALTKGFDAFMGGANWQSLVYALWEAIIAISMSIGLIAVFQEKWHHQNKIVKILSDNAFAVYVFHAPIIIAITMFFKSWNLLPIVKFLMMGLICLPTCFIITHYIIRKIPLLKRVM